MRRLTTLALIISMVTLALPLHAHARTVVSLDAEIPPPTKPIYEVSPGDRAGYIRTPGYWMWNGKNHVWQNSRWVEKREGYVWVPEQWEQRGDKWRLNIGRWEESDEYEDAYAETSTELKSQAAVNAERESVTKKHRHKKRVRKIDYRDPVLWPSPRRR